MNKTTAPFCTLFLNSFTVPQLLPPPPPKTCLLSKKGPVCCGRKRWAGSRKHCSPDDFYLVIIVKATPTGYGQCLNSSIPPSSTSLCSTKFFVPGCTTGCTIRDCVSMWFPCDISNSWSFYGACE